MEETIKRSRGRPRLPDDERERRYKESQKKALYKYQRKEKYINYRKGYCKKYYIEKKRKDALLQCDFHDLSKYRDQLLEADTLDELNEIIKMLNKDIDINDS